MSPIETLREAARLMRERAEAATPGPWESYDEGVYTEFEYVERGVIRYTAQVADTEDHGDNENADDDAEHIASWHPAVALAVADWLEDTATRQCSGNDLHWPHPQDFDSALAVARAYLGQMP